MTEDIHPTPMEEKLLAEKTDRAIAKLVSTYKATGLNIQDGYRNVLVRLALMCIDDCGPGYLETLSNHLVGTLQGKYPIDQFDRIYQNGELQIVPRDPSEPDRAPAIAEVLYEHRYSYEDAQRAIAKRWPDVTDGELDRAEVICARMLHERVPSPLEGHE